MMKDKVMPKTRNARKTTVKKSKKTRAQCHFISNTHWDREWRFSMQRTRHMLVYMMDMLLDIFEKEPKFKSFHLDSQTIPLLDYLEIHPEREELLKKYVKENKLYVGPWFCLPDEFSVAGESLVRNLLLGHKIANRFGYVSKTGYSPFGWGQISQMPQIYTGFGIRFAAFYRGINTIVAPHAEYMWQGPDGTKIVASRLGVRPRYNVWYVIQRPVFWNQQNENNRVMSWKDGHGPFKFVDESNAGLDMQYVHPRFDYFKKNVPQRAKQAYDEQDGDWTTPHRFWSCGHDSSCPDIREVRMIEDCDKAVKDKADVFHSSFEDFQKSVCDNVSPDLPVVKGEMRHHYTKGSTSVFFGWIISARMDLKQDNFVTERALGSYAEPMAVFASFLGASYPQGFVDTAYNWLLQNHGHDSIGGCSRDIIGQDMTYRTRQSRQISICVAERAMLDIAASIDLSKYSTEDMALVVFNPASFARSEVQSAFIEIPQEWKADGFEIVDEKNERVTVQLGEKVAGSYPIVQSPNDTANMFPMSRFHVRAQFNDIPALGYRAFFVKPVKKPRAKKVQSMLTGPQSMENEFIAVTINSNGTLTVTDKAAGKVYDKLGYFRDSSEIGNPWEHHAVARESVYTTLNEKARIALINDGELETTFRVTIDWALPEGRTKDDKARSEHLKPYTIVNMITLRHGQPWVEIVTNLDNNVEDHYLQVAFPTNIKSDKVMAQGQFDVVERSVFLPDPSLYDEKIQPEQPMNSFVDITDGKVGFALLNEGLKAYEAKDDPARTLSLTLLRSFPLRICVTQEMIDYSQIDKGSQCLGKHSFRYAVMPHAGDWAKANLWQAADKFNLAFVAAQTGPTKHGTEPLAKSFLELKPDNLVISAVKRSESGQGWVIRLFNPFEKPVRGSISLNHGLAGQARTFSPVERIKADFALPDDKCKKWSRVRIVTLEEIPEKNLAMDADGWVNFEIGKKKILTVEFLP
jgi:mannosylglycerate hydrolase